MSRNWAIAIGINDYNPNNFRPLTCAKQDAEAIRDFFLNDAGFDEVCFFADDSPKLTLPNGSTIPTYPSGGNLCSFLQDRFETPFLDKGDNCWFFFAGHGQQYQNRDYLFPIDAPNPRGGEPTYAISVSYVRERLSRSGADNVILLLDACRDESSRASNRPEWEPQQGIVTISACSPLQRSWEIESLQHGAFTYALLEALRTPGERNCATVERLDTYLRYRVPQLCRDHGKIPEQVPRIAADPAEKLHFILLPEYATQADIAQLKADAAHVGFVEKNWDLAEQICIRAIAVARGRDMKLLDLLVEIRNQKAKQPQPMVSAPQPTTNTGQRSPNAAKVVLEDKTPAPIQPPVAPPSPESSPSTSSGSQSDVAPSTPLVDPAQPATRTDAGSSAYPSIKDSSQIPGLPKSTNPPEPLPVSRKQFLTWLFLGGFVGVTGIGVLVQPRKSEPPKPSPSTRSSPASPQPVDYSQLESLLQTQQWKDADKETSNLMLKVTGRETEGWIDSESMNKFPCDVLKTIDKLWVKYSEGKFGFSVQAKIWQEVGSPTAYNAEWEKFGDRVGWRKDGDWLGYNGLPPSISSFQGFFPCFGLWGGVGGGWYLDVDGAWRRWVGGRGEVEGLFSRIKTCGL